MFFLHGQTISHFETDRIEMESILVCVAKSSAEGYETSVFNILTALSLYARARGPIRGTTR